MPSKPSSNARDTSGSRLHAAIVDGDADALRRAIASGADMDARRGAFREPPIIQTARSGRPDLLLVLFGAGADPSATDEHGNGVLHAAIGAWAEGVVRHRGDVLACLRHAAAAGAPLDHLNAFGHAPAHVAAMNGDAKALCLLIQAGADPLLEAAHEGRWSVVKQAATKRNCLQAIVRHPTMDHPAVAAGIRKQHLGSIRGAYRNAVEHDAGPAQAAASWIIHWRMGRPVAHPGPDAAMRAATAIASKMDGRDPSVIRAMAALAAEP